MDADVRSLAADVSLLVEALAEGGEIALSHFRNDPKVWEKDDGSPVSEADIAVEDALRERLCSARPDYGWMSEERAEDIRLAQRTFVVDPIDGTRAYLNGERIWSVVAAVIEDGRPLAAAIFAPVDDALYTAHLGGGALKDGAALSVSPARALQGTDIAVPGPLYREGRLRAQGVSRAPMLPSLALRLVKVAEGRFDGVVTRAGPHHWDLAAADLILCEAGGAILGLNGTQPRYDGENTSHPPVVAASCGLIGSLRAEVAEAYAALATATPRDPRTS